MFTLRKNSSKRASLSFLQPRNSSEIQQNCSSLLINDDLPRDNLIFLMLNSGCFREMMRSNNAAGTQYSTASICNQICSLLVFSSREFTQNVANCAERIRCSENDLLVDQRITVLLDAPKVPMKALRLVLRACQSALAYKIRQCVLLEQDWFVQHRVALEVILHEKYDFKVIVCPHSKLMHYIDVEILFDLKSIWREESVDGSRHQCKSLMVDKDDKRNGGETLAGKWVDEKKAFSMFFAANPSYSLSIANPANVSTASLLRLMKKDRTILIELIEHDLDSVTVSPISPMPTVQQNQAHLQEKFGCLVEEKSRRKGIPFADLVSKVGRTRLGLEGKNSGKVGISIAHQQKQRHSLISDDFSSSFADLSSLNAERSYNNTQKEFEFVCSSSVGSIIERNGGNWPTEKLVDEFATFVHRVDVSVRLLLGWIGEHGERRLTAMNDRWKKLWTNFTGELIYLDFIERERVTLTEETEEKLNELSNANDEMEQIERRRQANGISENSKELGTVSQYLQKAESQIYRLRNALKAYKLRIDNARRFKQIIGEFHKECDTLLLILYDDSHAKSKALEPNKDQIKYRINSINGHRMNMEKCIGLASESSSSFRFLLQQNGEQSNKRINYCAEEAVLQQISIDCDALTKRQQRISELVELWARMLKSKLSIPLHKDLLHNVSTNIFGSFLSEFGHETTKRREGQQILT